MSVPKWSQKLALVKLLWFFFQYIYLKNVNFRRALIFKNTFIATSSEACALTPSKCFAETDQKKKFIWFHFYVLAYGILMSEIIIFWLFLYLKESLVVTCSGNCAHTSRKYLTEQGMGVAKWSKIINFFGCSPIFSF